MELLIYGTAAAALVGYLLWLTGQAIWAAGSTEVRAVLISLVALAVGILWRDIRHRRFSLLSRFLVGIWILTLVLLVLTDFFSTIG